MRKHETRQEKLEVHMSFGFLCVRLLRPFRKKRSLLSEAKKEQNWREFKFLLSFDVNLLGTVFRQL